MTQEMRFDYCIAGGGIAGVLLASKLAASGKSMVILEHGARFTEADRSEMLRRGKETLNDYADYNDDVDESATTPHSSAETEGQMIEWAHQRLFGVGGTALHFEGIMARPREDDLRVRSLYGYGRDWPISYDELEPWLLRAEHEIGVAAEEDNPYASPRSGPFPMPGHAFSYFDREIMGPAMQELGIAGHTCPRAIASVPYRGRSQCLACRACKFCPSGARYSPDRVHVPLLEERPNVSILDSVSLRRLETNARGNRIVAAHAIRTADEAPVVVRADHFVLAMGGVETPRMLMLSADGSAHQAGLGNMGGQLGRWFSDHLNPYVTFDLGRPVGSRLGFETMISDHFRAMGDRRDTPSFIIFTAPAMDWFPVGIEATEWSIEDGVLSLTELRGSLPNMATLAIMTELEGQGVLELDDGAVDSFGSPLAKVSLTLTDWDRRAPTKLDELAPQLVQS
jgi:choline dehydrogenase-like flavoprotein